MSFRSLRKDKTSIIKQHKRYFRLFLWYFLQFYNVISVASVNFARIYSRIVSSILCVFQIVNIWRVCIIEVNSTLKVCFRTMIKSQFVSIPHSDSFLKKSMIWKLYLKYSGEKIIYIYIYAKENNDCGNRKEREKKMRLITGQELNNLV